MFPGFNLVFLILEFSLAYDQIIHSFSVQLPRQHYWMLEICIIVRPCLNIDDTKIKSWQNNLFKQDKIKMIPLLKKLP